MKTLSEALNDIIKSFSNVKISFDISDDNKTKLYHQKNQERDFLKMTKALETEMTERFVTSWIEQDIILDPEKAFKTAVEDSAEILRTKVLSRFGYGMKDIKLRPLSIAYIKQKKSNKIGINTGDLYRDIKKAKLKFSYKTSKR